MLEPLHSRRGRAGNLQGSTLSYAALDKRANQLAHRLARLGVRAEVPVGVMMERSLELVVALLGVLKAGGAYVPMDPSYPPDRLALMMEDSEARLIGQPDADACWLVVSLDKLHTGLWVRRRPCC
jgi:non-ribosomal peptide synthetase component F